MPPRRLTENFTKPSFVLAMNWQKRKAALLLAGCDGIAIVHEEDNCYFPIDWLVEQFGPLNEEHAEMLNKIKNNVLTAHRENLKLSSSPEV